MTSSSDVNRVIRRLEDITKALEKLTGAVKTLNDNFVLLGREIAPPKKDRPPFDVIPTTEDVVTDDGTLTHWCLNDLVKVIDDDHILTGLEGQIVNARGGSGGVEFKLCVRFDTIETMEHWFTPAQLKKLPKEQ